jgi:hypothetical protein
MASSHGLMAEKDLGILLPFVVVVYLSFIVIEKCEGSFIPSPLARGCHSSKNGWSFSFSSLVWKSARRTVASARPKRFRFGRFGSFWDIREKTKNLEWMLVTVFWKTGYIAWLALVSVLGTLVLE